MTKLFERLRLERLAIADTSRERYKNQKRGTNKSCWYFSALTKRKNTTNNAELCDNRQIVSLPWPSEVRQQFTRAIDSSAEPVVDCTRGSRTCDRLYAWSPACR